MGFIKINNIGQLVDANMENPEDFIVLERSPGNFELINQAELSTFKRAVGLYAEKHDIKNFDAKTQRFVTEYYSTLKY